MENTKIFVLLCPACLAELEFELSASQLVDGPDKIDVLNCPECEYDFAYTYDPVSEKLASFSDDGDNEEDDDDDDDFETDDED